MDDHGAARDLRRLRWIGVVLPVAFVWIFELLRFNLFDFLYSPAEARLLSAMVMGGGVVVFALVMTFLLDRAQRELVHQNTDLTATHAVSSAVRGELSLPDTLDQALSHMAVQTGALAGVIRAWGADGADEHPAKRRSSGARAATAGADGQAATVEVRYPRELPSGLAWVEGLLQEPAGTVPAEATFTALEALDATTLDLPLPAGGRTLGVMRLVFHPSLRPDLSAHALADIGGEIGTAIEIGRLVADLQRRERERAALYEVALRLTATAGLAEVLDTITGHARDLLDADRVVVCIADPRSQAFQLGGWSDRVARADDGTTETFAHPPAGLHAHPRNAACPIQKPVAGAAWISRPLRGQNVLLGEMCAIRVSGVAFGEPEQALLAALADMAAIAVHTARLRESEQEWLIVSERDRIARELHDSLAQVLGVIHMRLRSLEGRAGSSGIQGLGSELADVAEIADEAYRDVREAILGLRETISADGGLEATLREYLAKYSRQTGIQATLVCEGPTGTRLSPAAEVQLLRVIQEALTNVRKHAHASRATVRIAFAGPMARISVEDDGVGFDPAALRASLEGGFGMSTMRERVEQVGGSLEVDSAPGRGTRIEVRMQTADVLGGALQSAGVAIH
ncbi:MAG: sensor histidine kinase [Candidatus Limnocylindrales bacterium]